MRHIGRVIVSCLVLTGWLQAAPTVRDLPPHPRLMLLGKDVPRIRSEASVFLAWPPPRRRQMVGPRPGQTSEAAAIDRKGGVRSSSNSLYQRLSIDMIRS